jgi:GTPase
MIPLIALVGAVNVGKSTFLNCATRSRSAITGDTPSLTRDRLYATGNLDGKSFILVDTGGFTADQNDLTQAVLQQTYYAIEQAQIILFLVDAQKGITLIDQQLTQRLRRFNKPVYVIANKSENLNHTLVCSEFSSLGLGDVYPISAEHNQGIVDLMQVVLASYPIELQQDQQDQNASPNQISVAIVGRPNVGKSTLINCVLGQERVLVLDKPGTTRDSIKIPFSYLRHHYLLIDTAGIRRKARIQEKLEKISVIKSLQAIEASEFIILVLDAKTGIIEQDLSLLGFILEAGKGLVIAVNKWDHLNTQERVYLKSELARCLRFASFVPIRFISALRGTGIRGVFQTIQRIDRSMNRIFTTNQLTQLLERALAQHALPWRRTRHAKLMYAHVGGRKPLLVVIHGRHTALIPQSYLRYLENFYREHLRLLGPLRIELQDQRASP